MNINFRFQHNKLSAVELRNLGIVSTRELEEVILGDCVWEQVDTDFGLLIFAIGFTKKVKALKVVFQFDEDMTIHTLQAAMATVKEIKIDFCKYCK